MPLLLDLSNELIYKIIDHIHPDDISNFSLTRRELHSLAKDAVSLHLERQKTYERIVLDGCHRHKDHMHPLQVLKDMCMDWRVGTYVRTLTVECCMPPLDPYLYPEKEDKEDSRRYEVERVEDRIMTERVVEAIQGYVEQKAVGLGLGFWFLRPFKGDELCSEAARGDRSAMLALLFLLLPNLERIRLVEFTYGAEYLQHAVLALAELHYEQDSTARIPLKDLCEVQVIGSPHDDRCEGFAKFADFALLPAMQTMVAEFVSDERDRDRNDAFPPRISNVRRLYLLNSAVRPASLTKLLCRIKYLDSFVFDHEMMLMMSAGRRYMSTRQIIAALQQHAGHSLRFLALSGSFELDSIPCSLQGFEVLKELQLSLVMYTSVLFLSEAPELRYQACPLVYVLPASIEKVMLSSFQGCSNVQAVLVTMFRDFAEQKRSRLPKLKYVNFSGEHDERIVEICGGFGEVCENSEVTLGTHWE